MGTPEFPDLGKHCSLDNCHQLDFLPFTCDRCQKIYCLEHRSYIKHNCPKADIQGVTVVICPLCAKGVRLIPDQDPNIAWDNHVNIECDPSNYERATKKKKCPAPGCKEILVFSNTIKCRDCLIDHCLKHRFGSDHKCPGPARKLETSFSFMSFMNKNGSKTDSKPKLTSTTSSNWTRSFLNVASNIRASAEAGMSKLSGEINQAWQIAREGSAGGQSSSTSGGGQVEQCPQCGAKFCSVTSLVDHVQEDHERNHTAASGGVKKKLTVDVCPKCSRGFRDPVDLVEHVEKDHGGSSNV
ncbi:zinc finger AN1 and C2H2 domain-containing stress-associated protein 16 [Senna tora]|uniref:Zinc finger AN1 and C2H2 domain-containing stress-associated protein 16 n=1 Tax=Senna tora TaxID=362788 RepID=A0A834W028_9FABA|nr:zinc finger AN1 and C2H2 domain-containing stress-associated protein 16 [Senna tora]